MGVFSKPKAQPAALIPAGDAGQAQRQAGLEAALRRRRRGVAADILTSPVGIPAQSKMGETS